MRQGPCPSRTRMATEYAAPHTITRSSKAREKRARWRDNDDYPDHSRLVEGERFGPATRVPVSRAVARRTGLVAADQNCALRPDADLDENAPAGPCAMCPRLCSTIQHGPNRPARSVRRDDRGVHDRAAFRLRANGLQSDPVHRGARAPVRPSAGRPLSGLIPSSFGDLRPIIRGDDPQAARLRPPGAHVSGFAPLPGRTLRSDRRADTDDSGVRIGRGSGSELQWDGSQIKETEMSNRLSVLQVLTAMVIVAWVMPAAGQAPAPRTEAKKPGVTKAWTLPRTPWGHPDLQGMWNNGTPTPLERPENLSGQEFLSEKEWAAHRGRSRNPCRAPTRERRRRCRARVQQRVV